MSKKRVTVTVDEELLDAAAEAVRLGDADSVSSWIADAMADRHTKEKRLAHLSALVADYELEHGAITADEIAEQQQRDRDASALHRLEASASQQ